MDNWLAISGLSCELLRQHLLSLPEHERLRWVLPERLQSLNSAEASIGTAAHIERLMVIREVLSKQDFLAFIGHEFDDGNDSVIAGLLEELPTLGVVNLLREKVSVAQFMVLAQKSIVVFEEDAFFSLPLEDARFTELSHVAYHLGRPYFECLIEQSPGKLIDMEQLEDEAPLLDTQGQLPEGEVSLQEKVAWLTAEQRQLLWRQKPAGRNLLFYLQNIPLALFGLMLDDLGNEAIADMAAEREQGYSPLARRVVEYREEAVERVCEQKKLMIIDRLTAAQRRELLFPRNMRFLHSGGAYSIMGFFAINNLWGESGQGLSALWRIFKPLSREDRMVLAGGLVEEIRAFRPVPVQADRVFLYALINMEAIFLFKSQDRVNWSSLLEILESLKRRLPPEGYISIFNDILKTWILYIAGYAAYADNPSEHLRRCIALYAAGVDKLRLESSLEVMNLYFRYYRSLPPGDKKSSAMRDLEHNIRALFFMLANQPLDRQLEGGEEIMAIATHLAPSLLKSTSKLKVSQEAQEAMGVPAALAWTYARKYHKKMHTLPLETRAAKRRRVGLN